MSKIVVGIYQLDSVWGDVQVNREKISEGLNKTSTLPNILMLPETWSTGFFSDPSGLNMELLSNQLEWQKEFSDKNNIGVMGSVIFPQNDHYFNRSIYTSPTEGGYYNKRHLFQEENSKGYFNAGSERKLFDCNDVKILPLICYDLRFPVWSRNNLNYDVLVVSANWPEQRQDIWYTLLKARAIENQCYAIGINRVGVDGNNISYKGGSVVFGPTGEELLLLDDKEQLATIELDVEKLYKFREGFPVYRDADNFQINIE